jgi:hypothetical protein
MPLKLDLSMLYLPGEEDSAIEGCMTPVEQLAAYCLEQERKGNPGAGDEPPVDYDLWKTILVYDTRGKRKRDKHRIFWNYKDWRVRFALKFPDCWLPEPPRAKPNESITEQSVKELSTFYRRFHHEVFYKKLPHGDYGFKWYDGEYWLWYVSPHDAGGILLKKTATRREAREFLRVQISILAQDREDIWLFYHWRQMFEEAAESPTRSLHLRYRSEDLQLYGVHIPRDGQEECPITFSDQAAAVQWFTEKIDCLKAWGIKPPKLP